MKYSIDRLITGLNIFKKYNSAPEIYCKPNATWVIELQEEEFIDIDDGDKGILIDNGWRTESGILWKMLTDKALIEDLAED